MNAVDLATVNTASTQLARCVRLQERLIAQVCDGDLAPHLRERSQELLGTTDELRQGLQSLYANAQTA